ncbi:MAG TPA: hypothetical protein VG206_01940 [Terriglobia bacterium]|nr:hypothetical protein [Terriglobia bacterium]
MQPTAVVWLNATSLAVDEAVVRIREHSYPAVGESGAPRFVAVRLPNPIPAGTATLHLRYKGEIISGGVETSLKAPIRECVCVDKV